MRIECQQLSKVYEGANGPLSSLEDITFSTADREFVAIVGPSGCGKTTLLKLIAGLLEPSSGRVVMTGAPGAGHPRSAMVFQDHGLFPWMTVLDNVARALRPGGTFLMQDIRATSHVHGNLDHPIGTLLYTISCMHCMSVSLAGGGPGLGAMWGEETALRMLSEAGFAKVRVEQLEHDIQNQYYIAAKD